MDLLTALRTRPAQEALVVDCTPCGLRLKQVTQFDREVALGTFLQHHPTSPDAVHRPDVPAGWFVQLELP